MSTQFTSPVARSESGVLAQHKVLRQTYTLLAMTLLFSGVMAVVSMALAPPPMVSMVTDPRSSRLPWAARERFFSVCPPTC